jgi:hypothetical protein
MHPSPLMAGTVRRLALVSLPILLLWLAVAWAIQ